MSCSFDPTIPQRPGDDFFLWEIDSDSLGSDLVLERAPTANNPTHCMIKPKRDTTLFDYQNALASTRNEWRLIQVEVA